MGAYPASLLLAFAAIIEYHRGVTEVTAAFSSSSASRTLFGIRSISTKTTTSSPLKRYSSVSILDGSIPSITTSRPNLIPISSDHDATSASVVLTNDESSTMDSTSLGTLTVPSVGIGTISWSSDKLFGIENAELQNVVDMAVANNAAFLDTAERYGSHLKTALGLGWGETERLTRLLLERAQQKDNDAAASTRPAIVANHRQQEAENSNMKHRLAPVVATKFTPSPWRTTVQSVIDACEESRQRLGVEKLDLYQIHMPDIVQPFRMFGKQDIKNEIYWEGLAECYHRGLVKNVGVCNYGPTLLTKCHEALAKRGVPLASNQIAYSLIGRHNGAQETVDKCNELGVKVLAFYPFAMGLLTGKYSSQDVTDISDNMASLLVSKKTRFEEIDLLRYAKGDPAGGIPAGGIAPLLSVMERIAKSRNKTVAQVALNYIVWKGAIPIPGARTQEQLRDNIGAMGWRLSDTEVAMLEQTADSLGFGFDGAGFKLTSGKFVGYGVEKWALD